jgi:hypothetical protein
MDTWLSTLPTECAVNLLLFEYAGVPVAACFVGNRRLRRHVLVTSSARFLNETGDRHFDQLCIEHNGVLSSAGTRVRGDQLLQGISGHWDELFLSGVGADSELLHVTPPYQCVTLRRRPSPRVDLEQVRNSSDYLELLSSSTRSQIRRAYRLYAEKRGEVSTQVAGTVAEALGFFKELRILHARRWSTKRDDGAFSNPYMIAFHTHLIESRFAAGEIQLIRVVAGATTVGILYNFVHRGVVSFYQSGLGFEDDNRLKAGLVAHTEAVRLNARSGQAFYDFLAGDSRYKQSLATSSTELVWAVIRRPCLKFSLEETARSVKRYVYGRLGAITRTLRRS